MRNLIVNADDYGFDRNRSEAIRECFRQGLLTQTTAMVNMPYCTTAIQQARSDGFFDRIGLHINLTYGMPLTERIKSSRLFCADDGKFTGNFHESKLWRIWLPKFERTAVREEIAAQMMLYKDLGLPLLHIDSHHHAHTNPAILGIILELANEMGFKSIRISRNISTIKFGLFKKIFKKIINNQITASGLKHTTYFGNIIDVSNIICLLPDNALIEAMVHPLYCTGADMDLDREYYETDGVLCDTYVPMQDVSKLLQSIKQQCNLNYNW